MLIIHIDKVQMSFARMQHFASVGCHIIIIKGFCVYCNFCVRKYVYFLVLDKYVLNLVLDYFK